MNKLRELLIKLAKPKGYTYLLIPDFVHVPDEQYGRYYVQMDEDLRLYFEDDMYVGFSTQEPYVG